MTLAVISPGVWKTPGLKAFFPEGLKFRPRGNIAGVIGWGAKPSTKKAMAWAAARNVPFLSIEDGFIRSVGLGVNGDAPLSIVVDDVGIYYDASRPSRLEMLIANEYDLPTKEAAAAIRYILKYRVSKYNLAEDIGSLPVKEGPRVLVVDQTVGDISVKAGGCTGQTFTEMLAAALTEYPAAEIWVKTHPDVVAGKKLGYLKYQENCNRVRWIGRDCNAISLLSQFDHVYTATSQMGFEALMLQKRVTVFGVPWYAGWGLTDDRHPMVGELKERRPGPRSIEQLFAGAYLRYPRYIQPATGRLGTLFDVVDWIVRNRDINQENPGTLICVGMSIWKRSIVTPFLRTSANRLQFTAKMAEEDVLKLPSDARLVVWGSQQEGLRTKAMAYGVPVIRLEDGFIRSVGLGSDLYGPLSLAIDGPGIYYDPFSNSRLEQMLSKVELDEEQLQRARSLREWIVSEKISKYNIGTEFRVDTERPRDKVILVPGQVEDDASILSGSPRVRSNGELLARVRAANPAAWLIYKPHPDVVAGNRKGAVSTEQLAGLADQVVTHANIVDCIAAADEVHTMTSLAGFEALVMGKTVHCYGGPFYAGWGLTVDHFAMPHRNRRLQMDELLFVTLCMYPRYRLPGVKGYCTVEEVISYLTSRTKKRPKLGGSMRVHRQWRKAFQLTRLLANWW